MEETTEVKKIEIEQDTLNDLDITRKWSMFLAVLGFIFIGLMVILGLVAGVFLSVFKTGSSSIGVSEILILIVILLMGILYFFPILYLFRFSKHSANAVKKLDKLELHKAIRNLKRYYVFIGILLIVVLAIYVIAFIAAGASVSFLKDLGTGM